jgi:hypothetical protein
VADCFLLSHVRAFRKLIVLDVNRTGGNGRIIIAGVGRADRENGSGRGA